MREDKGRRDRDGGRERGSKDRIDWKKTCGKKRAWKYSTV